MLIRKPSLKDKLGTMKVAEPKIAIAPPKGKNKVEKKKKNK